MKIKNQQWLTEQQDLIAAANIISRHVAKSEGTPLGLIEVAINQLGKSPVEIRLSAWLKELMIYFRETYGHDYGRDVMAKVITRIVLKGETIH